MINLTTDYISRAELWLFISMLTYFLMNGAQVFETIALVPKWSAAPPESFFYFRKPYGLDLKTFWIAMHSIHEVTFIIAIIFCWKIESVRNWLLVLFAFHFGVRIWTLAYFAPNIIDFEAIANSLKVDNNLDYSVQLWKRLNYIRVFAFIAISIGIIPLFFKLISMRIHQQ